MSLKNFGKRYAGLTADPEKRRAEHGLPGDWRTHGPFGTEREARLWVETVLGHPGTIGEAGGGGWRYGYTYTITAFTKEIVEQESVAPVEGWANGSIGEAGADNRDKPETPGGGPRPPSDPE